MTVRVFVVDDSIFVRRALARVLLSTPDVRVVGEAGSGAEALEKVAAAAPDVVTLDVEMPGMDGISTLRHLLERDPALRVIMLSALTTEGAGPTLDALEIGAVDFIDKTRFNLMDFDRLSKEVLDKLRALSRSRRSGTAPTPPPRPSPGQQRTPPAFDPRSWASVDVCVIGASTGGPPAIQAILERVPADLPAPIAIVQHMPVGFTAPFAARLDSLCKLRVAEAADGMRLERGQVVIAPAGRHLRIGPRMTFMLSSEPRTRHVPSVDVLMASAAKIAGPRAVGVLLTGMGEDGAEGMASLHARGAMTVAESEATCVVYGMPRAAHVRGAVRHLLPLGEICDLFGPPGAR